MCSYEKKKKTSTTNYVNVSPKLLMEEWWRDECLSMGSHGKLVDRSMKWRYPIHLSHAFWISRTVSLIGEIRLFLRLSPVKQCLRRCESNSLEEISWVNNGQEDPHPSLIWIQMKFPTTYSKLWFLTFLGEIWFFEILKSNIREININFKN